MKEKTDSEIQAELKQKFGLNLVSEDLLQRFLSEVDCGRRGGLSRDNMKMSLDGIRSLFNFYWMQYAMYSIVNLDTVNVYTPATEYDVKIENAYAKQLLSGSRDKTYEILDEFTNNPNSTTTALGTTTPEKTWYDVGGKLGARYFYSKDYDYYNTNYPIQTKVANNLFVQNCLDKGDTIVFSHDPSITLSDYPNSAFAIEIGIVSQYYKYCGYDAAYTKTTIEGIEVWTLKLTQIT